MELISKELLNQIPKLYETEDEIDPIAYVKLFIDGWTWYITELSINGDIGFGYVVSAFGAELGYFSLEEIKSNFYKVIDNKYTLFSDLPYYIENIEDKEQFINKNKDLLKNDFGYIFFLL